MGPSTDLNMSFFATKQLSTVWSPAYSEPETMRSDIDDMVTLFLFQNPGGRITDQLNSYQIDR